MKIHNIAVCMLTLFLGSCQKRTASEAEYDLSDAYRVGILNGRILFEGIDHPQISIDLPDDQYEDNGIEPRHNLSRHRRCVAVMDSALEDLSSFVAAADTGCLLESLRYGANGEVDHYLARAGNWVILSELAARRPLPEAMLSEYGDGSLEVFRGSAAVGTYNLDELLELAAERNRSKN